MPPPAIALHAPRFQRRFQRRPSPSARRSLLLVLITCASVLLSTRPPPAADRLLRALLPHLLRFPSFLLRSLDRLLSSPPAPSPPSPTLLPSIPPPDVSNLGRRPRSLSLSFSGCSWLLPYHLGAASYFQSVCPASSGFSFSCAGSSCGVLAALALVCGIDVGEVQAFALGMVEEVLASRNPLAPAGRMARIVGEGVDRFLPEDAHRTCSGRLHVNVSRVTRLLPTPVVEAEIVSHFSSNEDLKRVILASCYIPLYYEAVPSPLLFDGGLTDNLPLVPAEQKDTITVSPIDPDAMITSKREPYPKSAV